MKNALERWHVKKNDVGIHVPDLAVHSQPAQLLSIHQYASVLQVILVIHLLVAHQFHFVSLAIAQYCPLLLPFILVPPPTERPSDPCNPSPCGPNAICKERNGAGSCTCLKEYFGDPYVGCRPECVTNSDCDRSRACTNNKCVDPCPGTCGINAECVVVNHAPSCSCIPGYTGEPTVQCLVLEPSKQTNEVKLTY